MVPRERAGVSRVCHRLREGLYVQVTFSNSMEQQTREPESKSKSDDADRAHLQDVEDGCGCTEIWEHMSENRDEE